MKTAEIQKIIFDQSGIKTTAKQGTGSMRGYIIISSLFQGGLYPYFPFELLQYLRKQFPGQDPKENFFNGSSIAIFQAEGEPLQFKKERKPKPLTEGKGWGSKNSQLRLDKAANRYAKRRRRGDNTVRYY